MKENKITESLVEVNLAERKKFFIRQWVDKYRAEKKIKPGKPREMEFSCEAFGEGFNLLGSLIETDNQGVWNNIINDNELRDLVMKEIDRWENEKKRKFKKAD